MRRRVVRAITYMSALLLLASAGLWVRTEVFNRTDTIPWGGTGVYRSIELSGDDAEYYVLYDPGYTARPLAWNSRRGGWMIPPRPSNPTGIKAAVMMSLPHPNGTVTPAYRFGTLNNLGFEYAWFPGWYGPGTSVRSMRMSYFTAMLPAGVLPAIWLVRTTIAWRRRRAMPGVCRACGYDLRATPERCPECGTAAEAPGAQQLAQQPATAAVGSSPDRLKPTGLSR